MRLLFLTILFALAACGSNGETRSLADKTLNVPQNVWTEVWADEFDSPTLDDTKWKPEVSCWGGGNDERQCYTGRSENVSVKGGYLLLSARAENYTAQTYPGGHSNDNGETNTQSYTSGKVKSLGLASWKYGRFEAKMKLPKGQGTWPAFWMLSESDSYGSWPLSGEIDILEAVNLGASCPDCEGGIGENRSIAALHFGDAWPNNTFHSTKSTLPKGVDDWHVFAVEWGKTRIDWFVDDQKIYSLSVDKWYTGAVDKTENPYAPFDKAFYVMLNLAVGGGLSEKNNDKGLEPNSFPAELLVDWVRVHQCLDDLETGMACLTDG